MSPQSTTMDRPKRWDKPFDDSMTDTIVDEMLQQQPFSQIDASAFTKTVPFFGILKNDCRMLNLSKGDIIVREGDYGSSAFFILDGSALVALKKLPSSLLGRHQRKKQGWLATLLGGFNPSKFPEVRDYSSDIPNPSIGTRGIDSDARVFLHDVPRVIGADESVELFPGEIFGEISALTRSPRSATVVANSDMRVLEIRWQGFRELLNRHHALAQHVETLYRENSLRAHLRETDIFRDLPDDVMAELVASARFESFGDFRWNREFQSTLKKDIAQRILEEQIIAEEGQPSSDLILIRSGFARLSRKFGDGHQTIAYLGKGQMFGLREISHQWRTQANRPWSLSLRAVGYVDLLRIPAELIREQVLPRLPDNLIPSPFPDSTSEDNQERRDRSRAEGLQTDTLEFLVEQRLVNGTEAMVIDLDRCTRCDDCVRACASTHDNNPRFNRSGLTHDHYLFAQACMHCLDPVCMIGCPTGAIGRDSDTGNVTINDQTCIGCSTCANSCPYDNIQMVEINAPNGLPIVDSKTGVPIQKATKCDLCHDHLGGPACVRACPHDALFRVDLSDSEGF